MIALAIILSYFLIGLASGRAVFVRNLGDSPRFYLKEQYANLSVANDFSKVKVKRVTDEMERAVTAASFTALFWPVMVPFFLVIQAPTPTEKARAKEEKQKELEDRFRQLESEVLSFGKRL